MYTELFNPLYGTVDGLPVIAVGAITYEFNSLWVVVDEDGKVQRIDLSELVVDTRFRDGQWHDTSPGALDAAE